MRGHHRIKNDLWNEEGNTYLFVLSAMFVIFAVFLAGLKMTQYEAEVSGSENKNSNMYYFALSGLEIGVTQLNQTLDEERNRLQQKEIQATFAKDLETKVVFVAPAISKPYEGVFYYNEQQNYQIRFLKEFYTQVGDKKFDFQVDTQSQQDHLYHVAVEAKYNDKTNAYDITSVATNQEITTKDGQRVSMKLSGKAQIGNTLKKEMIMERYAWRTPMSIFTYGAVSGQAPKLGEDSQLNGTVKIQENMDDLVNADIVMETQLWKIEKPLLVSSGGALSVDISKFYKDDGPINTAILQLSNEPLVLMTSDPVKNQFNGIIYNAGTIEIQGDLKFSGSIFSKGTIDVTKGSVTINNDSERIFQMPFEDVAIHRKLLDYFNITSFYKMNRLEVSGADAIKELLGNATIVFNGIVVEELGAFELGNVKMYTTE